MPTHFLNGRTCATLLWHCASARKPAIAHELAPPACFRKTSMTGTKKKEKNAAYARCNSTATYSVKLRACVSKRFWDLQFPRGCGIPSAFCDTDIVFLRMGIGGAPVTANGLGNYSMVNLRRYNACRLIPWVDPHLANFPYCPFSLSAFYLADPRFEWQGRFHSD